MRTFREALQSDRFTITADLTLQGNSGADEVARQADLLGPYVSGLQVTDNPWGWVQMSAVSAASLVLSHGIDPIPVLTGRDRNRIALHSDLLGLRALGVTSALLMRGNKIPREHELEAKAVFDVDGHELVAIAAQLNEQDTLPGKQLFIGVGAKAFRPPQGWNAASLVVRADSGARFLQTQLCFNASLLREYMQRLVEARITWKYSVIVSLTPIPSAVTARWLKTNLSDSRIPKGVVERLENAADPQQEGIAICAELMQEIAEIPGISGVNLMTTGNAQSLRDTILAAGVA